MFREGHGNTSFVRLYSKKITGPYFSAFDSVQKQIHVLICKEVQCAYTQCISILSYFSHVKKRTINLLISFTYSNSNLFKVIHFAKYLLNFNHPFCGVCNRLGNSGKRDVGSVLSAKRKSTSQNLTGYNTPMCPRFTHDVHPLLPLPCLFLYILCTHTTLHYTECSGSSRFHPLLFSSS
jgi:hypothetical protein